MLDRLRSPEDEAPPLSDHADLASFSEDTASYILKVTLAGRLIEDMLPEQRDVDPRLMRVFGSSHGIRVGNNALLLLDEWGTTLQALCEEKDSRTVQGRASTRGTKLDPHEYTMLAITCLLHDVGFILKPGLPPEEQRAATVDFILSNAPLMCLDDWEAAIVASLANIIQVSDIRFVYDWDYHGEPIRCRLMALAFHLANLCDFSYHRLANATQDVQQSPIPFSYMLRYALLSRVEFLGPPEFSQGDPRALSPSTLQLHAWAPREIRSEAEETLLAYFEQRLRPTEGHQSLAVVLVWEENVAPEQSNLVRRVTSLTEVSPPGHANGRVNERLVALRRLLIARSRRVSEAHLIRAAAHWLVMSYVSADTFRASLEQGSIRRTEQAAALADAIGPIRTWDWSRLRERLLSSPGTGTAFCEQALRLALDPSRYRDEQDLGEDVARTCAALIRSRATTLGPTVLPGVAVADLMERWMKTGPCWRDVAAEVILGPPTGFGRASSHYVEFSSALVGSARGTEAAELALKLMPVMLRQGAEVAYFQEFLSGALDATARRTRDEDARSETSVVDVLCAAVAVFVQSVPPDRQDAVFEAALAPALERSSDALGTDDKTALLVRLSSVGLGYAARMKLLRLGLSALREMDERTSSRIIPSMRQALSILIGQRTDELPTDLASELKAIGVLPGGISALFSRRLQSRRGK